MATYRKINTLIWWDPNFIALGVEEKLSVIRAIVENKDPDGVFGEYYGPRFRKADSPKRRPDLCSSEWKKTRQLVLSDQGTVCFYCGEDCADDPTIDHRKPVCKGGTAELSNLVVACRFCNSSKGGKEGWE